MGRLCTGLLWHGFLSTPSVRRATCVVLVALGDFEFLSTPSVRRATCVVLVALGDFEFLSTPSVRRATRSGAALS